MLSKQDSISSRVPCRCSNDIQASQRASGQSNCFVWISIKTFRASSNCWCFLGDRSQRRQWCRREKNLHEGIGIVQPNEITWLKMLGCRLPHVEDAIIETDIFILLAKSLDGSDKTVMIAHYLHKKFFKAQFGINGGWCCWRCYNLPMNSDRKRRLALMGHLNSTLQNSYHSR